MHYLYLQTKKDFIYLTLRLSLCFLTSLFFSYSGNAYFPWSLDRVETDKTEFYKLQINTQAMKFFNEDYLRYFAGAELKIQQPSFEIKASYTYSIYEDRHYFRPLEFNLKFERPDGQWIIGRKWGEWDWADLFWNRGLWQPTYADDGLRPQWAGLTGLFRDFNYEEGQIRIFGSFLFIPDSSAPFENKNGKLTSSNPWFISPPTGKIASTNIVPSYQVIEPDLKNFLLPSIGGRISYRNIHAAYAYKPMNKINIKTPFSLPLDKEPIGSHETGFLVDTTLHPVILQHHLLSGGFILESANQYNNNTQNINYRLKTSFTYNHPEKHTLKKERLKISLNKDKSDIHILEKNPWIFFQPQKEWHISVKGEVHVKDPLEETTLYAAYTHRLPVGEKEETTLEKALTNVQKLFFQNNLFQFSRAASAGIDHSIKFNQTQKFKIKARLIYHLLNEYFLFSFYSSLTFMESFTIFFSGDLLFSEFPFSIDQTKKDIGVYTNKSRIFGGLSYAF